MGGTKTTKYLFVAVSLLFLIGLLAVGSAAAYGTSYAAAAPISLPQVQVPPGWPAVPPVYVPDVIVAGIERIPLPKVQVPPGWPEVPSYYEIVPEIVVA